MLQHVHCSYPRQSSEETVLSTDQRRVDSALNERANQVQALNLRTFLDKVGT